jgi:dTDP-4-dehydrorhamnose reductase
MTQLNFRTIDPERMLFTGGSGLLGGEVRQLLPAAQYPASCEFDVTDVAQMEAYLADHACELMVHAAAFTSPPKIDRDPQRAIEVNIVGTANVVRLCMRHGLRLVYISTDYVFPGDRGHYREEDSMHPVNKYAWSKLGGECAVRIYDRSLIVRTSFGPNVFPYDKAFVDQWTSRQSVREIAAKLVRLFDVDVTGVIHLGGPRRSVFEYARSLDPARSVQELSIHDVNFQVPVDTSLNCERYEELGQGPG